MGRVQRNFFGDSKGQPHPNLDFPFHIQIMVKTTKNMMITMTKNKLNKDLFYTSLAIRHHMVVNSLAHKGSDGNKKLPRRRISTVGIARKVP
jgi:hypothetical protein